MKPATRGETLSVTIKVMGKEYVVNCPPTEHEALVASAEHLNERMTAVKKRAVGLDAERIAVMVALNLSRELLALQGDEAVVPPDQKAVERIRQMGRDIDLSLDEP